MRTALIDADILCHEIGAIGQFVESTPWGESLVVRSWTFVEKALNQKIEDIRLAVKADKVKLFLTCNEYAYNKLCRVLDLPGYKPNFRFEASITKPYKGTRQNPKPNHYWNIFFYIASTYDTDLSIGHEADDAMASYQTNNDDTVICSRDKDLRMVSGYHYTWACGKQEEIPLYFVDPNEYGEVEKTGDKVFGYGKKWFHYQMLVGDAVDNIPGLPGVGPAKALRALSEAEDEDMGLYIIKDMYKEKMYDMADLYFKEQHNLLWMRTDLCTKNN